MAYILCFVEVLAYCINSIFSVAKEPGFNHTTNINNFQPVRICDYKPQGGFIFLQSVVSHLQCVIVYVPVVSLQLLPVCSEVSAASSTRQVLTTDREYTLNYELYWTVFMF